MCLNRPLRIGGGTYLYRKSDFRPHSSSCKAFAHGSGCSAQIYVNDDGIRPEVEALFDRLVQEGWLKQWFTAEQAAAEGLEGPFQYVVEGADGYFFADAIKSDFFTQSWAKDGGEAIGKHGHHPSRGDMPPFLVSKPGLEPRELCNHSILDIAPTLQALFDLPKWDMTGNNLLA